MAWNYISRKYALFNSDIEGEGHLRRVKRHLAPIRSDRMLEVGCGRGFLTARVQKLAPLTRGVDLNPEAIANTVARRVELMNAEQLTFDNETFDKIYSFHCIEHLPGIGAAISEMGRVLVPGGRILLVYPAEPIRGLYVVPTAIYLFGNPFKARTIHIHRVTPRFLKPLIAGAGLISLGSRLEWLLTPQFVTVLGKPDDIAAAIPASTEFILE